MPERRFQIEPLFNLPQVIVALVAFMVAIQFAREFILDPETDLRLIWLFSFVPSHYLAIANVVSLPPLLIGSLIWTPVTYGLLHASWVHVLVNMGWMVTFGAPVARRFGTVRFLVYIILGTIGGAAAHLVTHYGQDLPLVGASAGIYGVAAGAARFVFVSGPLGRGIIERNVRLPAPPMRELMRNRDVIAFICLWFFLNLLVGFVPQLLGAGSENISWEAHIGGFIVGFFLFPWIDPVPQRKI